MFNSEAWPPVSCSPESCHSPKEKCEKPCGLQEAASACPCKLAVMQLQLCWIPQHWQSLPVLKALTNLFLGISTWFSIPTDLNERLQDLAGWVPRKKKGFGHSFIWILGKILTINIHLKNIIGIAFPSPHHYLLRNSFTARNLLLATAHH